MVIEKVDSFGRGGELKLIKNNSGKSLKLEGSKNLEKI